MEINWDQICERSVILFELTGIAWHFLFFVRNPAGGRCFGYAGHLITVWTAHLEPNREVIDLIRKESCDWQRAPSC
jgi:hypothetical protein